MRNVVVVGTGILLCGIVLIAVSSIGQSSVRYEYDRVVPNDPTGPCEGYGQDVELCNALSLYESLWLPGWIVLILGIVILVVGLILRTQQRPIVYTCPTCGTVLTWIAPQQQYYCNHCQKYL